MYKTTTKREKEILYYAAKAYNFYFNISAYLRLIFSLSFSTILSTWYLGYVPSAWVIILVIAFIAITDAVLFYSYYKKAERLALRNERCSVTFVLFDVMR